MTVLGGLLTAAGLAGLALLAADPRAPLFLYVSRPAVVLAGETGWLEDLPAALARRLGWAALAGTIATVRPRSGPPRPAAYLIHPLVLTTIMVLLVPVALVPEVKFVLVAVAGVAACFMAGHALTRVPGISRVL